MKKMENAEIDVIILDGENVLLASGDCTSDCPFHRDLECPTEIDE